MDDSDEEPLLRPGGEERQNLLGENSGIFYMDVFFNNKERIADLTIILFNRIYCYCALNYLIVRNGIGET